MFSVHYPDFAPQLPAYAVDSGTNKIRVSLSYDGSSIRFSPELFPTLTRCSEPPPAGELWQEFYSALSRDWQQGRTRKLNLYESFTLALRTRLARSFLAVLGDFGVPVSQITLETSELSRYYGPQVCQDLKDIILREMSASARDETDRPDGSDENERQEASPDLFTLSRELLTALNDEYEKTNQNVPDRFEWQSSGLNVAELAERTGHSRIVASMGAEALNDYGYASPLFAEVADRDTLSLERQYRSTEVGGARLRL